MTTDRKPVEGTRTDVIGWFIRNHVAANLLMIFLVGGGILAAATMRTELFPSVDPRMILIRTPYPGATAYEVEDGITRRIEEAVLGIEGIERITSTARENRGAVTIEAADFADMDDVLDDVETAVDQLIDFPPEDAERPIVSKVKPQPSVITLALYGDVPEITLKRRAERIQEEMLRTPELSLIDLRGDRAYEISIEISEHRLREYRMTLQEVARAVEASSVNIPAGTLASEAGDILLRVQEKGYAGSSFEDIVVRSQPDGARVRLKDIARIRDGLEDTDITARHRGHPAVFIEIKRSESEDALVVEQAVRRYLERLRLPEGLAVDVLENETTYLKQRMNLLGRNAILGYLLVFLTLLLFLDLKLGFWTSLGIPISFLGGLLIIALFGQSFNMITLFALIVVLGIVVDDAIVIGESIYAESSDGAEGRAAAERGVRAVRAPVTIAVLTSVAAFAPLAFTSGTLGQIMRPIPIFVISILLVSLAEAFLILPAHLAAPGGWSRGPVAAASAAFNRLLNRFLEQAMLPALSFIVRWRYAALAAFIVILLVVGGLVRGDIVRFVFFPQIEGNRVTARLAMPVGTPFDVTRRHLEDMASAARDVGRRLNEEQGQPIIRSISLLGGTVFQQRNPLLLSTAGGAAGHRGEIRIQLVDAEQRAISAGEVKEQWRRAVGRIPQSDELTYHSGIVEGGADVNMLLRHEHADILDRAAEALKDALRGMNGVTDIADSLKRGKLEYLFELTPEGEAAGLQPGDLGRQLRGGFYGYEVQRLQRERAECKVMVRYPKDERERLHHLRTMRLALPGGGRAPLDTVARIRPQHAFAEIRRVDGRRAAEVTADVNEHYTTAKDVAAAIMTDVVPGLRKQVPALEVGITGESEDRREDLQSLGRNMIIALLIIYVMLGAQLRSYSQPFVVMAIIPFGITGAVLGHGLLGYDLSFVSVFGMVALTGVVINDSVVMIDYFNRRRDEDGADVSAALRAAVRRRFRPILLTTMTTVLALLPMLLETSLQARFLIPMVVSLAFGLLFAFLVLLFLLPVLIRILEDIRR